METQTKEKIKHIVVKESTRDWLREVQGKYRCATFNEALLMLLENNIGVSIEQIKQMANEGATVQDLLDLQARMMK